MEGQRTRELYEQHSDGPGEYEPEFLDGSVEKMKLENPNEGEPIPDGGNQDFVDPRNSDLGESLKDINPYVFGEGPVLMRGEELNESVLDGNYLFHVGNRGRHVVYEEDQDVAAVMDIISDIDEDFGAYQSPKVYGVGDMAGSVEPGNGEFPGYEEIAVDIEIIDRIEIVEGFLDSEDYHHV